MGTGDSDRKVGVDLGLTEEEKGMLHRVAAEVIKARCHGKPLPRFEITSDVLKEKRGAFVTIEKYGQLRGCIGHIRAYRPLYLTIQEMAEAAAFNDPRFPPLKTDELDEIEIEISVLTPLKEIKDINEIQVGKHGIYIEKKPYHSGILLPQVATDYDWDRKAFLEHTCLKANLPRDAWMDSDTKIYIFSADIF